ncbi:hypothetical protein QFC22_002011 [Naganishia vaughanmartiniae]|uniref:Uncharacterized protein n=1 Tax=Naganishia vaughanmartiniae TaxID=1424756 RepID=A0ACC2XIP0_9TREE|nr:hypothetical protein QFC22_002011 [Naganishia vaughanmartiniae]
MDPDSSPASLRTTQQGEAVRKRARDEDADGHHGDDGNGNANTQDDESRAPRQHHNSNNNNGSWSFPPPHGLATPAHKQSNIGTPTSAVAAMALATPAPHSQQQPSSASQVPGTGSEQKKRRRTSPEELKILEDAYLVNTLPSSEDRTRLAERTGMTPRAVQIWFQNKRQTEKRKLTQSMYPNVMIIPIHRHQHSVEQPGPGSITPGGTPIGMPSGTASTSSAAAGGTPSTATWTTYHRHRAAHAHPGAPALGPAAMAYGTPQGYYVQSNVATPGGRPQPTQAATQQQPPPPPGYFSVLPPPGMMAYPHPHPHALHPSAQPPSAGMKSEAEQNAAQRGERKDSATTEGNPGNEEGNHAEEAKPSEEPLNTVSAADIRQGNPTSAPAAGSTPQPQGHPHPHAAPPWPYYTPGHPYSAYPYPPPQGLNIGPPATPTPGQGQAQGYPPLPPHLRDYYMHLQGSPGHPGQHVQAPPYPYPPPPPGTYAYPPPPHPSQQGQAVPVPFGYPSPYHLQYAYGAPSSAPPVMMAPPHPSAGPNSAPAGSYPAPASVSVPAETGAATPTPVAGANVGSATAISTSGGRGTMAYGFASSSERDNTGHVQRRGLSNSQATVDGGDDHEEEVEEEVEHEEDEDDETHGLAGMRRHVGSSPTPAHHAKATTTTTTTIAASSSSSSGGAVDFHRRNSGEATRAGFRMINSDSSASGGGLFASRSGPRRMMLDDSLVVKQEEDELEDSEAEVGDSNRGVGRVNEARSEPITDHTLQLSEKKPLCSMLLTSPQPASSKSLSWTAHADHDNRDEDLGQLRMSQSRPRSSMGFHHASESSPAPIATTVGSLASRGILDEMCAMRELPYKRSNGASTSGPMMLSEQDGLMPQAAPLSSSSPMLSCDSGDGGLGGLPSSEADPFGSTTITIPIPYARSRGQGYMGRQNEGKAYQRASPPVNRLGGGGRTHQRRPATARPSRSPDIFDRMSSDPPSGGLEELCADDGADARGMMMDVSGGLSDTDQEDEHSGSQRRQRASSKSMASSSGASGEYGPSSASTMILATPIKTEYDPLTGRGIVTTSETGGRKLRFVPSSATSNGNGRKRKLELTEDDDKENSQSRALASKTMVMGITSTSGKPRPVLGRVASLDFYAGSPAKRSSSLGAEARRLSEVVSKYAKTSTPPTSTMSIGSFSTSARGGPKKSTKPSGSADRDRRYALGALEGHRKLNGSSSLSAHSFGKASRLSSRGEKTTAGVSRSFSTGQLPLGAEVGKHRITDSLSSGRTDDEECARLLLGLGSSR